MSSQMWNYLFYGFRVTLKLTVSIWIIFHNAALDFYLVEFSYILLLRVLLIQYNLAGLIWVLILSFLTISFVLI